MDGFVFCAGVLLGLFSGLLPGLHPNTVISALSTLPLDPETLALLIIALYPASLVVSFIPSIFFGIPEPNTVVAILPGQRMVLQGEGLAALKTVIFSCIISALLATALFLPSLDLFPLVYGAIREHMKYILFAISLVLLLRSKNPPLATLIFILAGILGHFSLNSGMEDPFLPLFSGMFAVAAIMVYSKGSVPEQKESAIGFGFVKFTLVGVLLGMAADLIPGVGSPSQVATFATIFMRMDTLGYLAAISAISVSQSIFSLATAASIGKARVGATAWLAEYMDVGENLLLILTLFILSMAIAVAVVYLIRKHAAKLASLDFSRMNAVLLFYLVAMTLIIDGFLGLVILAIGGALGWLTIKLGVERTNLMGAIIVPTLLLLFRVFF